VGFENGNCPLSATQKSKKGESNLWIISSCVKIRK
jgi:hypothetical protein